MKKNETYLFKIVRKSDDMQFRRGNAKYRWRHYNGSVWGSLKALRSYVKRHREYFWPILDQLQVVRFVHVRDKIEDLDDIMEPKQLTSS